MNPQSGDSVIANEASCIPRSGPLIILPADNSTNSQVTPIESRRLMCSTNANLHERRSLTEGLTSISAVRADGLQYELSLAKKLSEQLGFLPKPALQYYCVLGGVFRQHYNEEPAGFVVVNWSMRVNPFTAAIYQCATQSDVRRLWIAKELVDYVATAALARGCSKLQCWCAADLEANWFWRALDFQLIQAADGGQKRKRHMLLWQRTLRPALPDDPQNRVQKKHPGGGPTPLNQEASPPRRPAAFLIPY